jgi:hypothetical protein
MTTNFKVGQRVRIRYGRSSHKSAGMEGIIEEIGSWSAGSFVSGLQYGTLSTGQIEYGATHKVFVEGHTHGFYIVDQLEPLDKPKQELGSWDALRELGLDVDAVRTSNLEKV